MRTAGWIYSSPISIDEIFSLYHNNGDGTFDDVAMPAGIGMADAVDERMGIEVF